ncbi:unnamed protein product [Lactuca virosa]|uniref:Uncharacterized protein n=1 Tax=Lactuca virosa TaxID=75947 RepID=A0AAU9M1S8_9ASTR|nr:unnamed protein product [Lactuca virosa]
MGIEAGESSGAGRPETSSGREDAGLATTPTSTSNSLRQRFSLAAHPEIMRAAQKDDQRDLFKVVSIKRKNQHNLSLFSSQWLFSRVD